MGEGYLLILDIYGAWPKKYPLEPPFLEVHFQPVIGQVGDGPAYAHQVAQKIKQGDAPSCFHLRFIYIGPWQILVLDFLLFLFSFNKFGLQVRPLL